MDGKTAQIDDLKIVSRHVFKPQLNIKKVSFKTYDADKLKSVVESFSPVVAVIRSSNISNDWNMI